MNWMNFHENVKEQKGHSYLNIV